MIDALFLAGRWYIALAFVGAAGLLPGAYLFDRLSSRGVLYARPLALAVVALGAWLIGWSGRGAYGTAAIAAVLAGLFAWSAALAWLRRDLLTSVLVRWRTLAAGDGLHLVVFALVAWARSATPAAAATEKPMDLMLIEAVHRAQQLPPPDPWLSGHTVSYYHLGHLAADAIGRLAGLPPEIAFNLVTASAGAMAAVAAAALATDVIGLGAIRRGRATWVAAGVAGFVLLLAAPLAGIANILGANGVAPGLWGMLGVDGVPVAVGATTGVPDAFWWWWTNTRILPGTISEFPAFTLLLGDPHAHLLALPIDLVAIALALTVFEGSRPLTWRSWTRDPQRLALTAAVFAAICLTNAWDVLIFGGIWAGAALVAFRRAGWAWTLGVTGVARWAIPPIAIALACAAPFLMGIDAPHLGAAAVVGEHSDPLRWLLVWLPPAVPALLALLLLRPHLEREAFVAAVLVAALPVEAWAVALALGGHASEFFARGSGWLVLAAIVAGFGALAAAGAAADGPTGGRRDPALGAACALVCAVLVILGLTELVRVADAFPGRMNTVFKFWFDAWAILAVGAGALAGLAADRIEVAPAGLGQRAALGTAGALLLASSLYVPAMAVSRAREGAARGLDALAYLRDQDAGLFASIEWSRQHLDPREDVMVQAIVESYHAGDMLAAASGVPTLLGWPNHERQWRASIPEVERRAAVDAIYAAGATETGRNAARRSGVTYVYIGREERAQYGADLATRFAGWPVAFAGGGATVVRVP